MSDSVVTIFWRRREDTGPLTEEQEETDDHDGTRNQRKSKFHDDDNEGEIRRRDFQECWRFVFDPVVNL